MSSGEEFLFPSFRSVQLRLLFVRYTPSCCQVTSGLSPCLSPVLDVTLKMPSFFLLMSVKHAHRHGESSINSIVDNFIALTCDSSSVSRVLEFRWSIWLLCSCFATLVVMKGYRFDEQVSCCKHTYTNLRYVMTSF